MKACEALGVPIITSDGFEADDVIGTLATQAVASGAGRAGPATGDKDFFQLVNDQVLVFNPKDEARPYDAEGVRTKFGVIPRR